MDGTVYVSVHLCEEGVETWLIYQRLIVMYK
jgi:hypothetical protein